MLNRRQIMGRLVGGATWAGLAPAVLAADPWTEDELIAPATLAKRIKAGDAPPIVCVASRSHYDQRHVRDAQFAGPGSEASGIKNLEAFAGSLSRDAEVVVYCGCCPMNACPNIRPAYEALKRLGFKTIRVLNIRNNLHNDWTTKGHPAQPPQAPRVRPI